MSSFTTFRLPAYSFRKVRTPLEAQGIKNYQCVVPISAIPSDFDDWKDVNARESSLKGRVPKAIRQTLVDTPEWFVAYNRGLTISAMDVKYNNQSNEIVIVFGDKDEHGILDGGHTLSVILDNRDINVDDAPEAYCRLEIISGLPSDAIVDVVGARNTSKQVETKSLMELEDKFDALKAHISPDFVDLISWKENQDGEVDVREFIAIMTAFDVDNFDDLNHPIVAYSGKEQCLKRFANNESSYAQLYPMAKEFAEIRDLIQYHVPRQYNDGQSKFGRLTDIKALPKGRGKLLPFIGKTSEYEIPNGYVMPILAAFRSMLDVDESGNMVWGKGLNPKKLISGKDELATKIFREAILPSHKTYHNPNKTGKEAGVWALAYRAAENFYLRV